MDAVCDELESQLEQLGAFVDEKLIDIKHVVNFMRYLRHQKYRNR
jgi:hypothetical protein